LSAPGERSPAANRLERHSLVSSRLAGLGDGRLAGMLVQAPSLHRGLGGECCLLTVDETPVFVKKVPLTDLERRPENVRSTANLFHLPLCCQYGIGGCPGFGAWRELAAHLMATDWVLTGRCANFPLLHHWRVLPAAPASPMTSDERERLERDVEVWEGSPAVRRRWEAARDATAHLVLFGEYVPTNLLVWLTGEFARGDEPSNDAVDFVERSLWSTNEFMNAQGLTHFDVHFENVMTDGRLLYFSDFGLAVSSDFDLTRAESEFLARHRSYDHARAAVALLHSIAATFLGKDDWRARLRELVATGRPTLPRAAASAVERHAPIALAFLEFSRKLREESTQTSYPAEELERMLAGAPS
jgi:hypothetical protein